jgi:uncharacterized protein (DUF2062 family)/SAM-dependent methyltransferase
VAKPSLLREELKRAWRELRGSSLSPARAAAAVALGIFIGSQPIFGCHTPLVLVLCLWLRLDGAIAWVAANISNPLFAPFLLTAEVQVGAWLRTGRTVAFDSAMAREAGITGVAGHAFAGAPLVGLALAALGALLVYVGMSLRRMMAPGKPRPVYRLPPDAPAWWHAAERLAARYAPSSDTEAAHRAHFHYVRVKTIGDPISRMVADLAGEAPAGLGTLTDLGTGRGQLPLMLLELGQATRAVGVDWDERKIAEAERAAAYACPPLEALPATFRVADLTAAEVPAADTVLLIDVLHYLALPEQDALLARAARAVRPGGRLLVREADTERGWRSWVTWLEEQLFTTLRFNRGARVCFRPARELAALLEGEGLRCSVTPAWGKTPFSNVLVVGTRSLGSAASAEAEPFELGIDQGVAPDGDDCRDGGKLGRRELREQPERNEP